jgi:hypothetical protein
MAYESIIDLMIALAVMFFMVGYFVIPYYQCAVAAAGADPMITGILLLVLFLALIGIIRKVTHKGK